MLNVVIPIGFSTLAVIVALLRSRRWTLVLAWLIGNLVAYAPSFPAISRQVNDSLLLRTVSRSSRCPTSWRHCPRRCPAGPG